METLFVGKNLIFLPVTDSTNSHAMELLKNVNLPEGTTVQAAQQSNGKGQRGATWVAEPESNLTLSVILRPGFLRVHESFFLYLIAALATYDTTSQLLADSQFDVRIKWPNDIYVNGNKSCGILIENKLNSDFVSATVIGIGMNVNQLSFEGLNATSLAILMGKSIDLRKAADVLFSHLEKYYLLLRNRQLQQLRQLYTSRMLGLGQELSFNYRSEIKRLRIEGITDSGLLRLQDGEKEIEADLGELRWIL